MKIFTASCTVYLLLQSPLVQAQNYVYEQLPGQFGGFSSDGIVLTVADNFELDQNALISGLVWWGGYFNPPPGSDNFTISLYSDNGGQPGTVLEQYDLGVVNAVATGLFVNPPDLYPEFEYSANLPTPFLAQAGVTYWLSIVNPPADVWLWEASASPLDPGVERSFNGGAWQPFDYNTSFALEAVPEPPALGLVALGVICLIRRRKARMIQRFTFSGHFFSSHACRHVDNR